MDKEFTVAGTSHHSPMPATARGEMTGKMGGEVGISKKMDLGRKVGNTFIREGRANLTCAAALTSWHSSCTRGW